MLNTQKIFNAIKIAAAGVIITAGITTGVEAQTWDNTGGTYQATGKMKMRGSRPGTGCAVEDASGTITGIGTSSSRIAATVVWSKPAGATQQVQTDLYFENLYVEGNPKTVTNVNVSGSYNAGTTGATAIADITYNGNFTYDGTAAQTIANTVAGGAGSGTPYSILTLTGGGEKTVPTAGTVYVGATNTASSTGGYLDIDASNTLNNQGHLQITSNAGAPSIIDGAVNVNTATGIFDIQSGGSAAPIQIGTGGTITLAADASNAGALTMGQGTRLEVAGGLVNSNSAYTNTALDASGTPSTVAYTGTGDIMPTVCSNPYGRLELGVAARTLANTDNVYINAPVSDALLFVGTGVSTLTTGDKRVKFINAGANADYVNTDGEVIGWVERSPACAATTASIAGTTPYYFHNAKTILTFNAAGGTDLGKFALKSTPDTYPSKRQDDQHDWLVVKREYEVDYTNTGSGAQITNMQLGFKGEEYGINAPSDGTFVLADVYPRMRLSEGYEPVNTYVDPARPQNIVLKDATGTRVAVTPENYASGWLSVTQPMGTTGIKLGQSGTTPGQLDDIFTSNQIVINTTPNIIVSISNGRWSNPATWDVGTTPMSYDQVIIYHQIYTGLYTGSNLFGAAPYAKAEDILATANPADEPSGSNRLAEKVTIKFDAAVNNGPSALVIGNNVAAAGAENMNFATMLGFGSCLNGIIVDATVGTSSSPTALTITEAGSNYSNVKGLYIMGPTGTAGANQAENGPIIRTTNLNNAGVVTNNGTIELGY